MGLFKNKKEELINYQSELIKTHFVEVNQMYEKMRTYRHDFRNHLQSLKILAQKGDLELIRNYLDELEDELNSLEFKIKTGNRMADAILSSKISLADSKKIKVVIDAHIPLELGVDDIDLCTIIGNLFDNAIEANMELPFDERLIRIYMVKKGQYLYISFTNMSAKKKTQVFKSAKGSDHGLGLKSIDRIIQKYDAYLSRNNEDGAFTTEILLPLN